MRSFLPLLIALVSGSLIAGEAQAPLPEPVAEAIWGHMFSDRMPDRPGLSAFAGIDAASAGSFSLGRAIDGFGAVGDRIWEARLVEAGEFVLAVYWHNPATGATRTVITQQQKDGQIADPTPEEPPPAADLAKLPVASGKIAEQTIREAKDALKPDERVEAQSAIRLGFAIEGFCSAGTWIWPCRIIFGKGEVTGLVLVDAASGTSRSIAPVNAK